MMQMINHSYSLLLWCCSLPALQKAELAFTLEMRNSHYGSPGQLPLYSFSFLLFYSPTQDTGVLSRPLKASTCNRRYRSQDKRIDHTHTLSPIKQTATRTQIYLIDTIKEATEILAGGRSL